MEAGGGRFLFCVFVEGDRVVMSRCHVVVPVLWQVAAKTVVCV